MTSTLPDEDVPGPQRVALSAAKLALLERRLRGRAPATAPRIPRRTGSGPAPLSSVQRRMWFLEQLDPGQGAYNVPEVVRLRGPLDVEALHRAWAQVVRRHGVLRTSFVMDGDEPAQLVLPTSEALERLESFDAPDARTALARAEALTQEPLTPGDAPLWRAALITIATAASQPAEHLLAMVFHHAIVDAWSASILLGDLSTAYVAAAAGQPAAGDRLPGSGIEFADYAVWEHQRLTGDVLEKSLAYWRGKLAGAPPRLQMPSDRPGPAIARSDGGEHVFHLSAEVGARLRRLGAQESATPFMVLLAGYASLLARFSGQDDICIGSPVAGRALPELEQVVGCFLNTVVLRVRLDGDPTFRELLRRVSRTALDAYTHAEVPLDKVIDELRPERTLAHAPVFQAMFTLQNAPAASLRLPGVSVTGVGTALVASKSDLSLSLDELEDGGLAGHVSYRTDLFDAVTIARLMEHLAHLLAAVAADPDQPVPSLPLAAAVPIQNAPVRPAGTRAAHHLVADVAERQPDAVALVSGERHLTYAQLDREADRLARWLHSDGVGHGDLVGIAVDRSVEMVVAMLAVWKAGAAYLPIDLTHPPTRTDAVLERVAPRLVLAQGTPPLRGRVVDIASIDLSAERSEALPATTGTDDVAYVVHTSGSTGAPKGVVTRHGGVSNYLAYVRDELGVGRADTVLQIAGLGFDASVRDLVGPLTAGARVVLLAPGQAREPSAMLELVRTHRVSAMLSVVPTLLRALVESGEPAGRSLRILGLSGERLLRSDVRAARALFGAGLRVVNQFGPTECTMTTTFYDAPGDDDPDDTSGLPVGRPIAGAQVLVLDAAGHAVPAGVVGEIHIGGAGLARGYLHDEAQTAQRFVSRNGSGRLYRTGDLGRWRFDGDLEFLGRLDQQIKIRGVRVEPGEVEAALRAHPQVRDAVVVGHGEPARLVAYVSTGAGAGPQVGATPADGGLVESLRAHLRDRLPESLLPAGYVRLDELPRTSTGKVDRGALPAPVFETVATAYVAPVTDGEVRIAEAWKRVLGVEQVGAGDNFFDLGGDSFAAVKATRDIGDGMKVIDLFRHPTVRALAAALSPVTAATLLDGPHLLIELTPPRSSAVRLTVVALPYAGGSPVSFAPLAQQAPTDCRLMSIALPGHDLGEADEALARPVTEVAAEACEEILRYVEGPVALYGHCSGNALAVEIAHRLEAAGREVETVVVAAGFPNTRLPGRLFDWFSRHISIDRWAGDRTYHTFFRTMGGFGDDLSSDEVRQIVRNLRYDSKASEDYFTATVHEPGRPKLAAPLVCIVGDRDPLTEYHSERYREWGAYAQDVRLVVLEQSGHYFVKHRAAEIIEQVTAPALPEPRRSEPAPPPARAPGLGVFALVALGEFVSLTGSGLTAFALGVWTFLSTGSVTMFGLMSACALVPAILVAPFAGAVVDRTDRRRVMLVADLCSGLGTGAIAALLATHRLQTWHIFVVLGWMSACGAFQRPAYLSAIPQLIPKRYLARANGIIQTAEALSTTIAPLLAGTLVVTIGLAGVIVVDVVTFVVAVTVLALVKFPNSLPWRRREPLLAEVAGGWRFIVARRGIVALLLHAALTNLFLSAMAVLLAPLVLTGFGAADQLGWVLAAGGAGGVVGGLAMALWGGPRRLMTGVLGFCLVGGACISLIGVGTSLLFPAAGMFGFMVTLAMSNGCYVSLIQVKVPHHLHGRVFALNQMIAFSTMPLGYLLAGPLVDHVFAPLVAPGGAAAAISGRLGGGGAGQAIGLTLVALGVLTVLATAVGYVYPPLWHIEDELKDASPDADLAAQLAA